MRVYVETFGCAQNQGEGSAIAEALHAAGHEVAAEAAGSDAGVLVTCVVIGPTEARMVRRWRSLSDELPHVIVTGCLVPLRSHLLTGPGRDRTTLVPIREQHRIPGLLGGVERTSTPSTGGGAPAGHGPGEVPIAQGCTSHCAYCFSRLARGRLSSVDPQAIVDRVRRLAERGAAEVRLSSLDTSCWGVDRPDSLRLPDLLAEVERLPGRFRVRVGMMSPQSLEPILDEYLEAVASLRFFRFLHLPIQSGSDAVLASMRRGYTVDSVRRIVRTVRRRYPELSLATDVIAGYPTESPSDHRATLDLLEELTPSVVNVTRFSPRPLTPASLLPRLSDRVVKERSRELTRLKVRLTRQRLESEIGRTADVTVVEAGTPSGAVGRTENYLPVVIDAEAPIGTELEVRIEGARSTYLLGTVADGRENPRLSI